MSINEVKVGSLIRVKVGRNLIYAKVIEILDGAVRVCSLANNKEFNVPESRVQLDGEQPVPANAEPQTEATAQTESEPAETAEQELQAEQPEATAEAAEQESPQSKQSRSTSRSSLKTRPPSSSPAARMKKTNTRSIPPMSPTSRSSACRSSAQPSRFSKRPDPNTR